MKKIKFQIINKHENKRQTNEQFISYNLFT